MTEINLLTSGQRLIVTQRVVIASGDIESVKMKVAFDSAWDNYPARTATFYTSKDSTVYERLMADNECAIPHEVVAEAATLFIGVRGASVDGTAIKTSSLVKYKIEPGAASGQTTMTPSMDLYQQYLAAMDDKVDPFRADMMNRFNAMLAEVDEKLQKMDAKLAGHILWENEDTSVEFAPQTISLNLSAYKRIVVINKGEKGNRSTTMYEKGEEYEIRTDSGGGGSATNTFARMVSWNDSGVTIGTLGSHNDKCIPTKIIGYKSGGIATESNDDDLIPDFDL